MRTGALLFVLGAWAIAQGANISVRGGVLRVEKNSQIRMTDDLVDLSGGTIIYQVLDPDAAQVAIQTPSVSVQARAEGVYRISVRKTGESEITAQSGRMVVMAPGRRAMAGSRPEDDRTGAAGESGIRIVSGLAWWRRLASLLQNMQIGGGVGVGGGEEQTAAAKETRTKPNSENAAVPSGSAHSSEDRAKTSDGHSNTSGNSAHSGDSRPATSSGSGNSSHSSASHAAPANNGGSSSHSSESHAAPAASSSSHSDSASKGK